MKSIYFFNKRNLKYNLVQFSLYKNSKSLPKIKKFKLETCSFKNSGIWEYYSSLLALERITNQKAIMIAADASNLINDNVQERNALKYIVTLRKKNLITFLEQLIFKALYSENNTPGASVDIKKTDKDTLYNFSLSLSDISSFSNLSNEYYLFYNLSKLLIKIVLVCNSKSECLFILKSFKVLTNYCIVNMTRLVELNFF